MPLTVLFDQICKVVSVQTKPFNWQDQCMAKTPFIPPVASKKRAAWLWDESVVKEFFDEVFSEEYYEATWRDRKCSVFSSHCEYVLSYLHVYIYIYINSSYC